MKITVNGVTFSIDDELISYDQIVLLSHGKARDDLTVTYYRGRPSHPEGSVAPGESVPIHDGMAFSIAPTDYA